MDEKQKLSDAEVLDLLAKAQKEYLVYLDTPTVETAIEILPTYSSANPVGLVVDAILD